MGAKKDEAASKAVVVSARRRPSKLQALMMLGIILVAGVGAVAWLGFHNSKVDEVATPEKQHTQTLQDVAKANKAGNYSAEAQQLQAYIDSNPPTEYAETEVVRLATAYQNAKDYDNAVKWFQVAVDKYPNSKLAGIRGLAFTYMAKGDKQKAIEYFEKAIEIEKADPNLKYLVKTEENNLRHLRGEI